MTTPVPVPYSWLDQYFVGLETDEDYEERARELTGKVSGGTALAVWQDYLYGTDPFQFDDLFFFGIRLANGRPVLEWAPNRSDRTYTVKGSETLEKGDAWQVMPGVKPGVPLVTPNRFFKLGVDVKVE